MCLPTHTLFLWVLLPTYSPCWRDKPTLPSEPIHPACSRRNPPNSSWTNSIPFQGKWNWGPRRQLISCGKQPFEDDHDHDAPCTSSWVNWESRSSVRRKTRWEVPEERDCLTPCSVHSDGFPALVRPGLLCLLILVLWQSPVSFISNKLSFSFELCWVSVLATSDLWLQRNLHWETIR